MSYSKLIRDIEKDVIKPLYLLHGEEGFLIDEAVEKIISKAIGFSNRDFNLEILKGSEINCIEIVDKAQTLPFMGDKRVIVVKYIDDMSEIGMNRFLEYCSNPSPTTCLVLIGHETGDKILSNTISKKGEVIQFNRLSEGHIINWIGKKVKGAGYMIDDDAKEYLLEIVGNDIKRLNNEIEKIFTFKGYPPSPPDKGGGSGDIKIEDIRLMVEDTKVESIFDFTDSIGSKDIDNAIKLLGKMLNQGEVPVKIISMIARQLRLILLTKVYKGKNIPSSDLPAKAGFKPFLLNRYLSQAEKYSIKELERCFLIIQKTDVKLKSSGISEKILMEKLVFDLCGGSLN